MLLMPNKGIQLPLVSVTVSVAGFYFLSPLIVLAGHLVTLRKLPKMFPGLKSAAPNNASDKLSRRTDLLMLICLLSAGPGTLIYILTKFTAYQSPHLFLIQVAALYCACYAARIRGRELLATHLSSGTRTSTRWLRQIGSGVFEMWLLVCVDVIFLPAHLSPVLWVKTHTYWLDNEDGGTVAWVPHIAIDRGERLWSGPSKTDAELASYSGHADPKEYFMVREVAMDLRSRNLRYLDVSLQVIPRIWAHNADLAGANFAFSRLYGSVFVNTTLNGANFELASLDGATFMNMDLVATDFAQTSMKGSYWDNVTVRNAKFVNADLTLSSFFNTSFDNVAFLTTTLQATSLFEVKGGEGTLTFTAREPFKILSLAESDDWPQGSDSPFEVNPQAALESLRSELCKPKLSPDWAYAWGLFIQTKLLIARTEPEVTEALQDFMKTKGCEGLPDRGFKEDAMGILAAAAKDKAAKDKASHEDKGSPASKAGREPPPHLTSESTQSVEPLKPVESAIPDKAPDPIQAKENQSRTALSKTISSRASSHRRGIDPARASAKAHACPVLSPAKRLINAESTKIFLGNCRT
ncbi:pentapeptide repeat-containing protein [Pseudomonas sp. p106]|uniref:pentapeptide repeat-containing protein n=1 Tax=Pseudomonas sp. p106 TaxID=2479854 RepID=UPI001315A894|nr:pentapeptide repeat-containing protein [Pseudomonas sp. p106]